MALALLALPAAASAECSNEAIRKAQHSTQLGDCRAWEMVSPPDKNGGEVFASGVSTIASTDGNALSYSSFSVFGDSLGSGRVGQVAYVARRGPAGWVTRGTNPRPSTDISQVLFGGTRVEAYSDDLSQAITFGYDFPESLDDTPNRSNMYVEDTATRALRPVTVSQLGSGPPAEYPFYEFLEPTIWGASSDLQHVAFVSSAQMLPEGTAPGYPNFAPNVYTWDDGILHLAGILPDGTVPPEGSEVQPENYRGAMSADGSRQAFFASPAAGAARQLYQRIDSSRTVWISEPEGSDKSEPQGVHLQGMTPDGRNVFFSTTSAMTKEDTDDSEDLYRWTDGPNPESEDNLTLITGEGSTWYDPAGFGTSFVGASEDGQVVFYHEPSGGTNVWDHGTFRSITAYYAGADARVNNPGAIGWPGSTRVSGNGRWLAFLNPPSLNPTHFPRGPMYLYDLKTDTLMCASCSSYGGTAQVQPLAEMSSNRNDKFAARPSFLSEDGRVFFSTPTALLPEDVNGVQDVYEFDGNTGELHLISSGKGTEPTMFADASASGNDVFITTRQRLTTSDKDSALDFYDARSQGGFAESEEGTSGCAGEGCQAGAGLPPAASAAASSSVQGAGNVKPKRCRSKKSRGGQRVGAHCGKKHSKKHHRRAGSNRGASR